MPHEFELLLRDFNSCQTPDPHDPLTEKALRAVALNIYMNNYTLQDFNDFVENSFGNGYFAHACKKYVENELNENN